MRDRTWKWRPLAAALAIGLAACGGTVLDPEPPGVQLTGVRLLQAALLQQTLEVDLRLTNPNAFDLSASGITLDLDLAGRDFAQAVSNQPFSLPPQGAADVTLTTSTTLANWLAQAESLARTGTVDYRLQGAVNLAILGNRALPFTVQGEVELAPGGVPALIPR